MDRAARDREALVVREEDAAVDEEIDARELVTVPVLVPVLDDAEEVDIGLEVEINCREKLPGSIALRLRATLVCEAAGAEEPDGRMD